ncbi:MAG: sialate O-acetylesterase [Gammaproteobacteria bacterium]
MKKMLTLALLASVFYAYGIATVTLKIFPYHQIQTVKNQWLRKSLPLIGRYSDTSGLTRVPTAQVLEPLVFVTYGQSNSINAGQLGYETSNAVYMFLNGSTYKYQDPAVGGTGTNGSVWGRVGDRLVEKGYGRSIVFVSTGWGGASIKDLTFDHPFEFFEKQVKSVISEYGKIDGILFHQGESNHRLDQGSSDYKRDFLTLYTHIETLTDAPVYLSQASICRVGTDETLLDIQDRLIIDNQGILRGPNSDQLSDPKYRLPDYCHFSSAGLDEFAKLWVTAIMKESEL